MVVEVIPTERKSFFTDPFFEESWKDHESVWNQMQKIHKEYSDKFWNESEGGRFGKAEVNATEAGQSDKRRFEDVRESLGESRTLEGGRGRDSMAEFFERADRDFKRSVQDMEGRMNRDFLSWRPLLSKWNIPTVEERSSSKGGEEEEDRNTIRISNAPDRYEICLNVSDYKPDELTVRVSNNQLTIEGRHESKSTGEEGNSKKSGEAVGKDYIARFFKRKYELPAECDVDKTFSNLSEDGILQVTTPKIRTEKLNKIKIAVKKE